MNDTVIAATIVSAVVTFVVTAAMYIWVSSALHAMFAKTGQDTWRAWVPFLNVYTVLQLGGFSGWWVLLVLFPPAAIALFVILIVACHRINLGFDYGAAMTLLAAVLFPVWASLIGWGSADNWQPTTPVVGPRRSGSPGRERHGRPGPGELGVPRAVSDRLFAGFAPADTESERGPEAPHTAAAAQSEPVSQVPLSEVPLSRPASATPSPEPVAVPRAPVPDVAAPDVASPAEESDGAGPEASDIDPVPAVRSEGDRDRKNVEPEGVVEPEGTVTPDSFASLVRSGSPVPSSRREVRAEPESRDAPRAKGEPESASSEISEDGLAEWRQHHRAPFTGTTSIPAAGVPEPVLDGSAAAAPRPARAEEADGDAEPSAAAPSPTQDGPDRQAPTGGDTSEAWAPPPTRRTPPRPSRTPAAFSETSDEVSAVAGAPSAGLPMSALSSVSARAGQQSPTRTPVPPDSAAGDDGGVFDETMIASRRRVSWSLTPPHGDDIALTAEVAIIGRRPAADAAYPSAQLITIDDRTRTMSKTHARLELRADRWRIVDLHSTNGVVLQEPDGTEVELAQGQSLPVTETFLLGDAPLRLTRDLG